jgi:hypothetical protein
VGHSRDADELLEVQDNELRSVVGDDARIGIGEPLLGSLQKSLRGVARGRLGIEKHSLAWYSSTLEESC